MELPRGLTPGAAHQVRIRTFWGSTRGGGLSGVVLQPHPGGPTRVGGLLVWTSPIMVIPGSPVGGYLFRLGTLLGYF
jgi:hypothetical protein